MFGLVIITMATYWTSDWIGLNRQVKMGKYKGKEILLGDIVYVINESNYKNIELEITIKNKNVIVPAEVLHTMMWRLCCRYLQALKTISPKGELTPDWQLFGSFATDVLKQQVIGWDSGTLQSLINWNMPYWSKVAVKFRDNGFPSLAETLSLPKC